MCLTLNGKGYVLTQPSPAGGDIDLCIMYNIYDTSNDFIMIFAQVVAGFLSLISLQRMSVVNEFTVCSFICTDIQFNQNNTFTVNCGCVFAASYR